MASSLTSIGSQAAAVPPKGQFTGQTVLAARKAERYSSSGIWVGVFAIGMSFAAFTSALFVREGTSDWTHLALPPILYFNTLLLVASSGTLEMARYRLSEQDSTRRASGWVSLTLLLGLAFCVGQYRAWLDLRSAGIYLASNPNSSFFYLLTFLHVLHVGVGIAVLVYVAGRLLSSPTTFRLGLFRNTAVYWHFMAVLWLYLLVVCLVKL